MALESYKLNRTLQWEPASCVCVRVSLCFPWSKRFSNRLNDLHELTWQLILLITSCRLISFPYSQIDHCGHYGTDLLLTSPHSSFDAISLAVFILVLAKKTMAAPASGRTLRLHWANSWASGGKRVWHHLQTGNILTPLTSTSHVSSSELCSLNQIIPSKLTSMNADRAMLWLAPPF